MTDVHQTHAWVVLSDLDEPAEYVRRAIEGRPAHFPLYNSRTDAERALANSDYAVNPRLAYVSIRYTVTDVIQEDTP